MDDLDSCPAAANNYKEWNHLYITYKLNITLLQRKLNKLFRNTLTFYSQILQWSFRGPHGLCVYDKIPAYQSAVFTRVLFFMNEILVWPTDFGVTVEHRNKVVTNYCSCPNACEKVLKPEVTAGYFILHLEWPRFFYSKPPLYQPPTMITSSHISWHLVKEPHYLLRFLRFKL